MGWQKIIDDLDALDGQEYLQFLIETQFKLYQHKNLLLSIYDANLRLCFTSSAIDKLYGINGQNHIGLRPTEMSHFTEVMEFMRHGEEMLKLCLDSGESLNCLLFGKFRNLIGAVHTSFDPIFDLRGHTCGVEVRSFDATSLIFGVRHLFLQPKKDSLKYDLSLLNGKQQQVLFLLALDITQREISTIIGMSRGGVSSIISKICETFNFTFDSSKFLVDTIGKEHIIQSLNQPEILFKPFYVRIPQLTFDTPNASLFETATENTIS